MDSVDSRPERSHQGLDMAVRHRVFTALSLATYGLCLALAIAAVAPAGPTPLIIAILVMFAGQLPWMIVGFWNATIGFVLMRLHPDPLGVCCPVAKRGADAVELTTSTAILLCIRNEDTEAVFRTVNVLLADLERTGQAGAFALYVLSDTSIAAVAAEETAAVSVLERRWAGVLAGVTYRRRTTNPGFKAGNIRDFCERWGQAHDFALVLDADSFMSGARIVEIARIMQASPSLGILQCLTVGLPSESPLARLFQFGMRLGMRSYTLGGAWWQGDCGPYWGHNAIIRLAPFIAHCDMPTLPGKPPLGGDILSHDQVEAVLMRRAGYEVRVIPIEGGSYEENPPTMIEFIRRDLRWCVGNMQYFGLLAMPGLLPISRVQLLLAIWLFLASACNVLFWSLVLIQSLTASIPWLAPGPALTLIGVQLVLTLAPKLATALTILSQPAERKAYGNSMRFGAGLLIELLFSFLITPIMAVSQTAAMLTLLFGRTIGWGAQVRSEHAVSWRDAALVLWPQTLFGIVAGVGLASLSWAAMLWALPVYGGLIVAIPLTVATSSPAIGRWMARMGLCSIPEERDPPAEIVALQAATINPANGTTRDLTALTTP